ncbi:DUF4142 domain-containing protein [Novosphingobium sp. PhB165]|uniref:DUF4142 domain-containing protein n=1 Tax=Novosphingobium sp. PhB165 TaxID=2485105 RepID=UPI00104D53E7|nr:DUF4142 domain-containing protein [Novosphingobium sp. PhB165]
MKNAALFAIPLAVLALAGCKKESPQPAEATSPAAPDTAMPPAVVPTATETVAEVVSPGQAFANTAAASDAFEIAASKLAATHAQSANVKHFAEQMITAHTKSTTLLKTAASAAIPAITPDPTLSPAQQQTLDTLATKSGKDFDEAFAKAQVDGHQATLDVLKAYSSTGDVPSLKAFADHVIPIVVAHLNMAKAL